jgi:alpha-L-rhamnosidase
VISSEIYDGEVCDLSIPTGSLGFEGVEEMDFPLSKLQASKGPPVRKIESIRPKKVLRSPSGKVIVDFGQNLVGWVRVVVAGPRGRRIVFTHTEVLENGEIATRPLRDCKAIDTLILDGREAPIEWEPKFTFHGFRYVQIEGWPSDSGEPALSDISAVVIHTDMEPTGSFKCSDDKINQLHSNIRWGMRGNFVSIPTDCPQRDERLGWTGDIQIFAPTANFLFDTSDMLAGWLQDLAAEQLRDYHNVPPLVCPNVIDTAFSKTQAAWADAVIIVPYALHQSFGDKRILEQQYESMKAWIDHGLPRGENRLWDPEVHQLGDWLDPAAPPAEPGNGRTDPHFVANAYLVHITTLMAEISRILESSEDHERYVADAKELKKEFQYQYITPSGRLSPDSMTALCLALSFSLFPTHEQEICAAARLALLVRKSNFRIATGFVGTPLICPILCKYGYEQIAYRMLLNTRCPSWLYPIVKHGATTMWERWDSMLEDGSVNPGSMTSFNHYALGSVGAWLHSTVGGISPLEPGWKKIRFAPVPGGTITSAEVGYESCYGRVECEWKIEDGELKPEDEKEGERGGDKERKKSFWMKATLPPYTTGEIKLPTREKSFEVGSGVHEWQEEYEVPDWPPKAIRDPFATDGDTDD